jgi:23S rRNA (uracil1939-C5)-methyltransferase
LQKAKTILEDVLVTSYAAEGKGLARVDGKVIFIENAVPGDIADVLVTRNKKDWMEGKIISIKEFSKERIDPFCKHFGICGGCKWQMLPYEKQLEYKQQEVKDIFKRIGGFESVKILPILGSEKVMHYRNKLEFTASTKKYITSVELRALNQNEWPGGAIGFHVPRLYDKVIDIFECWLMEEENNLIRNNIRDFCLDKKIKYYDIKEHKGFLRNIIIRKSTLGELMINLVFGYDDESARENLISQILKKIRSISTIVYTINPKWNDSISDLEPKVAFGKGFINEKLAEFQFKISPKSFFQTNSAQAKRLYDQILEFADLKGNEIVYDLYCGTGSIGIYISKKAFKIIGVEVIKDAINDARENASLNSIDNISFFCGDVFEVCNTDFLGLHGKPDVIIVDPPRSGLHAKLVDKLLEIAPDKIIYVSCNVATQARDLHKLAMLYEVGKLQPIDMFPQTHHIECIASLKLNK